MAGAANGTVVARAAGESAIAPVASRYRRREPERTLLHATVRAHWKTFLAEVEEGSGAGGSLPQFVVGEFERYLACGILAHGFARVRCTACGDELLVALSCKGRGVCPSCTAWYAAPWVDRRVKKLEDILDVAKALAAERDLDRLLIRIVDAAARVVEADRCSLLLVDRERGELWTKVAQGQVMKEIRIPMDRGIAGSAATGNVSINIPDAYADPRFNRNVDKQTGYRTKTILCVPMRSMGEVVGVLQALNKLDDVPFTAEDEDLLGALGSQAAAAVNNALLHNEIEQLFEGFVRASVMAIESSDPTTAGHSVRVARLSVGLGDMLPRAGATAGRWKGASLSGQERQELRYAALLHDFGNVGVRENVLVKANKLEPWELENMRSRFETIYVQEELAAEREKGNALLRHPKEEGRARVAEIDARLAERRKELSGMFEFVVSCNRPTILPEGSFDRLGDIARGSYVGPFTGKQRPFLSQNEVIKLSVRKGALTEEERREIESHVTHTYRFLMQIPWTRTLRRVPDIVYGHHEKLNGRGYPRGLKDPEILLPTRMMTISDIYDALTASDRPYKRAVPRDKAYDILGDEAKRGELDSDLLRVFIEADVPGKAPQEP
jgi:HD-GYP domain-containing protein (c-di-GMP phosphodiesterase class II)